MKNWISKRKIALLLVCLMAFGCLSGFTYYNGFGTAYYESQMKVFDGVTYNELIGNHSSNGIEHGHYVEANVDLSNIMPMVFAGEVRGVYTIADMIKYAQEQGYKVLAAINGDIYDTSSGTPKGLTIHDGNIVTGGYQSDRVIAFDKDGKGSLQNVNLTYGLSGSIGANQSVSNEKDVTVPVEKKVYVTESAIQPDGTVVDKLVEKTEIVYETQKQTSSAIEYVTRPFTRNIDFFNVPQGAANGLHLYNRHYASSTKTKGSCVEVVVECSDIQLKVNGTIKGKVKSVNPATNNTPITDNTVVLSTVLGSASYATLSQMAVGSDVEISVKNNGAQGLTDAKEAIGVYYSIVENGQNVTTGANLNPRTAFGIKSDGNLVMFEVDGRQASVSKGLGLSDLANTMISIGCQTAVNFDGGGSSVFYVRQPGKDSVAVRQNSPSEGSERRVANGLLLVYKDTDSSTAAHLNVYPELTLTMPGATAQLSTYASNSLYEKASLPGSVSYSVDPLYGTVDDSGLFKAGDTTGKIKIAAISGSLSGETTVEVTKDIIFTTSINKLIIEANQKRDINVNVKAGTDTASVAVNSNDSLFTWTCDANIGTIDQNGVFTAIESVIPQQGNIYVSYNNVTKTIPVQLGAHIVEFSDTKNHWAKNNIGVLAGMGVLKGSGNNMFMPDGAVTRAEFLTMLANMTDNAKVTGAAVAGFTDVAVDSWYYNYVNWGFENGIVNGMGDKVFAPNASITREQMAVMLCNYSRSIGFALPIKSETVNFTDYNAISSWAVDYVATVAKAGIIGGFDTGDFKPQGIATRAQAAKVIYVMCQLKGII